MRIPFMLICTMVFLSALNVGCKSTKSGSSVESSDCFTDDPNDSCPDGIVFKVDGPRSFQFHQYGERWDGWGPGWSGQVGKDNPHQEFLLFGPYLSSPRSAKMVSVRTSIELQGEACNQVDHSCGAGGEVPEVVYRGRIADRRIIPPPPARASRAAACVTMKLRAARAEPQPRRCPPGAPVQYSQREIAAGDLAIPQRKACGDLVRRPFIRPILNARRSASALTTRLSCSLLGSMSWDLMPLVDPMPSST